MEQTLREPGGRIERRTALIQALVKRSIREFEELEGFDAMEIARALLAAALARVERQSPEDADGVSYLSYLKNSKEKLIASLDAHEREWSEKQRDQQTAKEASCRN